ncbi:MAG: CYTH domain-containing protein [Patescibacteria group bacterium]
MNEYEVKLTGLDKASVREVLARTGTLENAEHVQHNLAYHLPPGREIEGGWLRIRNENGCIAMSLKIIASDRIEDQFEYRLVASSMEEARGFLELMGATQKAEQEKKREIWRVDDCEVVIDEWPFLEAYLEVEGPSEASVKAVTEKLGFDYASARVCSASRLYTEKYGVPEKTVNDETPILIFGMDNPFT